MSPTKSIITDKDVLILKKLLEDGRASSSSISKEIDLGREIVNYRIKRLVKENLIVKFIPKVNEKALNYQEYIIFLKLNLDDEISKEKFIKEHIGHKYLIWTVKSNEGWDLIVRLYAQSVEEFKLKLSEILENFSDVLADYYTIISSEGIKESEKEVVAKNLFDEKIVKKDFETIKAGEILHLDDKDKQILNLLEDDARVQYKEIADKIDVSSDTVKYRIERMKEQGVLEGITPVINFSKLGLYQYAIVLKCKFLNKEEVENICEFLNEESCVVKAIKNLNVNEFFLTSVFETKEEKENFIIKVKKNFSKINSVDVFRLN